MGLENTDTPKYLGVTLDRTLSYKTHIHNTKMKVATRNNLLKKWLNLSSKSKNPCIRIYATVRKDHPHGNGGGLLIFIHRSITKQPSSLESLSDPHLEKLTIRAYIGNTKLIISNIYTPSQFLQQWVSIEHLLTPPDILILGDFNAHNPS